jgi:hypothetical protein
MGTNFTFLVTVPYFLLRTFSLSWEPLQSSLPKQLRVETNDFNKELRDYNLFVYWKNGLFASQLECPEKNSETLFVVNVPKRESLIRLKSRHEIKI